MRINPVSNFNIPRAQNSFGIRYVEENSEMELLELEVGGTDGEYLKAFNQLRKEIEEHPQLKDLDATYGLRFRYNDHRGYYISPTLNGGFFVNNYAFLERITKPKAREKLIGGIIEMAKFDKLI